MCGFVVSTEGREVDGMIDAQRFRGPDERGETIRYFNALTWSHVLLDQALLAERGTLKDPTGFVTRLNKLMLDLNK